MICCCVTMCLLCLLTDYLNFTVHVLIRKLLYLHYRRSSSDRSCMLIIFLILVHMMQEDACLIRFIRYHINCLILMRLYYYILIDLLAVSIQRIHSVRDNVAILETNHIQLINSNFNQKTVFISKLLHFAIKT